MSDDSSTPQEKTGAASKPVKRVLCRQPAAKPVVLSVGLAPPREFAIRLAAKKWVNGTVIHYCFIDEASQPAWTWTAPQQAIVRGAAAEWNGVGTGLSLVEVNDATEAEILIGCLDGDGSWSLVGTDNLDASLRDRGRTLNYGWDLTTDWGKATARHELGHVLGFSHEHQSPNAGIVWNAPAVYQYFEGPPNNWSKDVIDSNIIQKLDPSQIQGSSWDPTSIMEYPFDPGLIVAPKPYDTQGIGENLDLSQADKDWIKSWYPALGQPAAITTMQLQSLNVTAGKQRDFSFSPDATRDYTVATVGQADARVVVFEMRDGEPRHLVSEDNSGTNDSIALKAKLIKGREYVIRARVSFKTGDAGLLVY